MKKTKFYYVKLSCPKKSQQREDFNSKKFLKIFEDFKLNKEFDLLLERIPNNLRTASKSDVVFVYVGGDTTNKKSYFKNHNNKEFVNYKNGLYAIGLINQTDEANNKVLVNLVGLSSVITKDDLYFYPQFINNLGASTAGIPNQAGLYELEGNVGPGLIEFLILKGVVPSDLDLIKTVNYQNVLSNDTINEYKKIIENDISLPFNIWSKINSGGQDKIGNNPLLLAFVNWSNQPANQKVSYKGVLNYDVIQSWDDIFFNGAIFNDDFTTIDKLIEKIEKLTSDNKYREWVEFNDSVSNGVPKAVLGKKNLGKFLSGLKEDDDVIINFKKWINNSSLQPVPGYILKGRAKNTLGNEPHNLILYGAPGTGKSFELKSRIEGGTKKYSKGLFPSEELRKRITFHPNYSYRNFVGSYKPIPIYREGDTDKKYYDSSKKESDQLLEPLIEYVFEAGPLLEMYVKAHHNPDHNFVIIIEELNRANPAAVFGDMFQLLDRKDGVSEYPITLEPAAHDYLISNGIDSGQISLPSNLYLWATMNNADQGVMPMDSAFKRRWYFEYMALDENQKEVDSADISFPWGTTIKWNKFRDKINTELIDLNINEDKLIGPFFLKEEELENPKAILNKLLLYLKDDVLKYNSGIFKKELKTFSKIVESYNADKNVFEEKLGLDKVESIGA